MVSKRLALLIALSSLSIAYKIPTNTPSGIYAIPAGSTEPIFIGNFSTTADADVVLDSGTHSRFGKRDSLPSSSYVTSANQWLNKDQWNNAYSNFQYYCSNSNGQKLDSIWAYSGNGGVVTYMCSYSSARNPCNTQEHTDAGNRLIGQLAHSSDQQIGGMYILSLIMQININV
jgi:hypothetical protein